ncbi:MAG: hypothetical protein KDB54_00280 [Solirubrobacterales bacterium]|nr:hypothetical protein [Solirubrobacterales bacterium]MCB0859074.1 hypothetical protein [Solirubrobacterales bacterium]
MAENSQQRREGKGEGEPTEEELAACALVVELLRSGRILTYIGDILVERVDEIDFPGESEEAVVIRRFCQLTAPGLAGEEAAGTLWNAARLIESVRDRIVTDFQLELGVGEPRK